MALPTSVPRRKAKSASAMTTAPPQATSRGTSTSASPSTNEAPAIARTHRAEVALPEHQRQVLEEQRQAEREQELVVLGGVAVGLDDHALDERCRSRRTTAPTITMDEVGIDPAQREQPVGGVHAEHHHRAVGEVDDAQHAEDQSDRPHATSP